MITGLSKAIILYLAPLLYLTALLLTLFAFLAPAVLLHQEVALVTITPSLILTQPGVSKPIDGPSVFLGPLGSCSKPKRAADAVCTDPSITPTYDTSVLPSSTPALLYPPSVSTGVSIAISLGLSFIFFITFNLISFRHKMGKAGAKFDQPLIQKLNAWIGVFGFVLGLMSFLFLRMWFGKGVEDFNRSIQALGPKGPQIVASIGNAFTMAWVAYAFYAAAVTVTLAKLNVLATKGGK